MNYVKAALWVPQNLNISGISVRRGVFSPLPASTFIPQVSCCTRWTATALTTPPLLDVWMLLDAFWMGLLFSPALSPAVGSSFFWQWCACGGSNVLTSMVWRSLVTRAFQKGFRNAPWPRFACHLPLVLCESCFFCKLSICRSPLPPPLVTPN